MYTVSYVPGHNEYLPMGKLYRYTTCFAVSRRHLQLKVVVGLTMMPMTTNFGMMVVVVVMVIMMMFVAMIKFCDDDYNKEKK